MTDSLTPDFAEVGAQLFAGALTSSMAALEAALADLPVNQAGMRLHGIAALAPLLDAEGCIGAIAAKALGPAAKPVRAILFNKTGDTNWSLGWHQDRTICVKAKHDVAGFGPWTVKQGLHHVAPPMTLLSQMVTLRAHLDYVPASNAPLLIAPGTHRLGQIAVGDVDAIVRRYGQRMCLARAGDVWLYATPILHASEAPVAPTRRRVLQVDYAACDLPGGLEWLGV
jgi:hypothetical protein